MVQTPYARRNRKIGTTIAFGRSEDFDLTDEPGALGTARWWTLCQTHGTCASHYTRRDGESFVSAPWEWCQDCDRRLMGLPEVNNLEGAN